MACYEKGVQNCWDWFHRLGVFIVQVFCAVPSSGTASQLSRVYLPSSCMCPQFIRLWTGTPGRLVARIISRPKVCKTGSSCHAGNFGQFMITKCQTIKALFSCTDKESCVCLYHGVLRTYFPWWSSPTSILVGAEDRSLKASLSTGSSFFFDDWVDLNSPAPAEIFDSAAWTTQNRKHLSKVPRRLCAYCYMCLSVKC